MVAQPANLHLAGAYREVVLGDEAGDGGDGDGCDRFQEASRLDDDRQEAFLHLLELLPTTDDVEQELAVSCCEVRILHVFLLPHWKPGGFPLPEVLGAAGCGGTG